MMHEHILGGCTPTPLAAYLKALGILRLVAEQKDPGIAGRWQGEQFVVRTVLNREELERFFLEEYRPTPIVAPWNGGSGFYPNDNKSGLDSIVMATTERLGTFKEVIVSAAKMIGTLEDSPKDEGKSRLLYELRATLPDSALAWFDAAVLLSTDKPEYPPLLGTGGNDGRLDFTNNFMQRLIDLINSVDGKPTGKAKDWLPGSLYGKAVCSLTSKAIGQFSPGNAGGPNATSGFSSDSLINPWDFVLMMEGALLFAGAATRRMEKSDSNSLSYPFTVRMTNAGSGNVANENKPRAEIWMPLWKTFVNFHETLALLAEGRVTVGRRAARDGLDFVRAVSGFGVDRGITDFQRFGFLMRSGKAYLATPLARMQVTRNPKVDLLNQLDRNNWLDRLRGFSRDTKKAPGRMRQLVRRLEDEIFSLAQGGGRSALQGILILLGRIQSVCAVSGKAQEAIPPIPQLTQEWAVDADDGSDEFRLACALAGLTSMRNYIVPLKEDKKTKRATWHPGSVQAVWGGGDLLTNLLRVLDRRLLDALRSQQDDKPLAGSPPAELAAVMAFLHGKTDDRRLAELLVGLVNVELPRHLPRREIEAEQPPAAFRLLAPLFTPDHTLRRLGLLAEDEKLPLPRQVVALLKSGNRSQAKLALEIASRRLRIAGLKAVAHPQAMPDLVGMASLRLAAALTIPLAKGELARICKPFMPASETNHIISQGG